MVHDSFISGSPKIDMWKVVIFSWYEIKAMNLFNTTKFIHSTLTSKQSEGMGVTKNTSLLKLNDTKYGPSELLWKWLKIGEIEVCWNCQNRGPNCAVRGPIFCLVLEHFITWKIGARMEEFGARCVVTVFFRNVFLGQICSNFMGVTFTINIGFVSK